ncbi:MAG: hypothetical protein Kow0080_00230 [Candidatus Promineifilaceae bacterium]
MRKRIGPVILFGLGAAVIVGGLAYWQFLQAIERPSAAALPETLAGLPQVEARFGPDAVAVVADLHGKQFPLSSGAYGMYGEHGRMAMLWVAGTPAKAMAARMVAEMEEAIAKGESPFTPTGTREVNGRTLYELTGMGQRHFYFQSGSLVVWLAADEPITTVALEEAMQFYP